MSVLDYRMQTLLARLDDLTTSEAKLGAYERAWPKMEDMLREVMQATREDVEAAEYWHNEATTNRYGPCRLLTAIRVRQGDLAIAKSLADHLADAEPAPPEFRQRREGLMDKLQDEIDEALEDLEVLERAAEIMQRVLTTAAQPHPGVVTTPG